MRLYDTACPPTTVLVFTDTEYLAFTRHERVKKSTPKTSGEVLHLESSDFWLASSSSET